MSLQGDSVVGNLLRVAGLVLGRLWGDQTKEAAALRRLAEEAAAKKKEAYAKLRAAQRARRPLAEVAQWLSAYNSWGAELDRLREQAGAERA